MRGALQWPAPTKWHQVPFRRLYRPLERPVPDDAQIVTAYTDGQVTLRSNRDKVGYHEARDLSGYQGVEPGDLVVHGLDILRGSVGVSDSRGAMSSVCTVCAPCTASDPRYVAYVIRAQASAGYTRVLARGIREGGADFRRWDTLGELPIPKCPVGEQRRIADFLDDQVARLDRAIGMRRVQQELTEEAYRSGANALILGASNDHLTEAEWKPFGAIPSHWGQTRLRSVRAMLQTGPFGSQLHSDEYFEDGWPVVNPASLQGSRIVAVPGMSVDSSTRERLRRHILREGDVVFGRRGELGRAGLVTAGESGWLLGTGSLLVRLPSGSDLTPRYLMRLLETKAVKFYFDSVAVGTTMANLNVPILGGMPLLLPPVQEQTMLVAALGELQLQHERIAAALARSIQVLADYKRSLITAAVTGDLDVTTARPGVPV